MSTDTVDKKMTRTAFLKSGALLMVGLIAGKLLGERSSTNNNAASYGKSTYGGV